MGIGNSGEGASTLIQWAEIRNKYKKYIRDQLKEDYMGDQLTLFEEYDPFTGEKNKKNKEIL